MANSVAAPQERCGHLQSGKIEELSFFTAAMAGCRSPAGPVVLWSRCSEKGADLQNVNLTKANLVGSDLSNTR